VVLVPRLPIFLGDAPHGSHRVVAPMVLSMHPTTFPEICNGLLFRSILRTCVQNLKFVALPVPEIIGVLQKFEQSSDTPTLHFLPKFLENKTANISETRKDRGKVTMDYGEPIGSHQRSFEWCHHRPPTASSSPRLGVHNFTTPPQNCNDYYLRNG